jgi:hypothetical protein
MSMRSAIYGFVVGCCVMMVVYEGIKANDKMPGIKIEKMGKIVGYADTNSEYTEFAYMKDARSPGMFLAFPIYGKENLSEQLE